MPVPPVYRRRGPFLTCRRHPVLPAGSPIVRAGVGAVSAVGWICPANRAVWARAMASLPCKHPGTRRACARGAAVRGRHAAHCPGYPVGHWGREGAVRCPVTASTRLCRCSPVPPALAAEAGLIAPAGQVAVLGRACLGQSLPAVMVLAAHPLPRAGVAPEDMAAEARAARRAGCAPAPVEAKAKVVGQDCWPTHRPDRASEPAPGRDKGASTATCVGWPVYRAARALPPRATGRIDRAVAA